MRINPGLSRFFLCVFLILGCGAAARSAGLDEAVGPSGAVAPAVSLTATQRAAIYAAVMRQGVSSPEVAIPAVIGASVPPAASLRDLPVDLAPAADEGGDLKYAMVADDVVVVDPIRMRVIDVIHSGGRP